jgi:hypothetical protein
VVVAGAWAGVSLPTPACGLHLQDKPCLVVLNKCDAPVTVSRTEVELVMALSELERMMGVSMVDVIQFTGLTSEGLLVAAGVEVTLCKPACLKRSVATAR